MKSSRFSLLLLFLLGTIAVSVSACKDDPEIDYLEALTGNTQKTWKYSAIYQNGSQVTLSAPNVAYRLTLNADSTWSDNEMKGGKWILLNDNFYIKFFTIQDSAVADSVLYTLTEAQTDKWSRTLTVGDDTWINFFVPAN